MVPSIQDKEEAHSSKDPGHPPPPPCISGSTAALIAQFQQCHGSWSREVTPHGMPEEGTANGTHSVQHPREGGNS